MICFFIYFLKEIWSFGYATFKEMRISVLPDIPNDPRTRSTDIQRDGGDILCFQNIENVLEYIEETEKSE